MGEGGVACCSSTSSTFKFCLNAVVDSFCDHHAHGRGFGDRPVISCLLRVASFGPSSCTACALRAYWAQAKQQSPHENNETAFKLGNQLSL